MTTREVGVGFTGPMVRAILAGRKSVTRRLVTVPWKGSRRALPYEPWWIDEDGTLLAQAEDGSYDVAEAMLGHRYGAPGDLIWVRESWHPDVDATLYAADYESKQEAGVDRWFPSIHLRRCDARLELEVVSSRIERLHAITGPEILAEGVVDRPHKVEGLSGVCPVSVFDGKVYPDLRSLWAAGWNQINGKRAPWASNPWVWRIEFKRAESARGAA